MGLAARAKLVRWLGPWASSGAAPPDATRETLSLGGLRAHLYAPARARPTGAYLLAPGLHYLGPDDPRLDRFCRVLAASGFLVLAPHLPDFLALRISPRTVDDLALAFDHLERAAAAQGLGAPAIFSISFGSQPAIALAARRSHRARVRALVVFGGFVDFDATARFAITGEARHKGRVLRGVYDPLNAPVVHLNLLPHLGFDGDTEALTGAWRTMVERTWGRAELKLPGARDAIALEIGRGLGPREEDLFLKGCGLRPGGASLLEEGLRAAGDAFAFADPRDDLKKLVAPVVIVHGRDDDVIPWFEAEKLRDALAPAHPHRLLITGMYGHTGSARPALASLVSEARTMLGVVGAIAQAAAEPSLGIRDAFGLRPIAPALRAARRAVTGYPNAPPNRFGASSLRIFKPQISIPTWLGRRRSDGRVPIYNLFNRVPAPRDEGYSVRVTFARDFQGQRWTYDGHLGTDFAVPVGTPVVAAAPGVVTRVANDFDRGGLKVCIDHGAGLFTTSNHLARAGVKVGERVKRGQVIGRSGASGMEFVLFFPWVAPHLHFNTWLNGVAVDPFACEGEQSLWRRRNEPVPHEGSEDDAFEPSSWSTSGVAAAIAACRDPVERARIEGMGDLASRAAEVLVMRNYHPSMFEAFPDLYEHTAPRRGVLDLPFRSESATGVLLPEPPASPA